MEQIFGFIERIIFQNSENGFTVALIKQPRKKELTTIVGSLSLVQPGETVRLHGEWKNNATHGLQFEVTECHVEAPCDIEGIQKYLESGLVKGIGPIYAERIVQLFGEKTLDVIEKTPEKLLDVAGIGKKRVEKITKCWSEQKAIRSVMIFLQKYGVTPGLAQKLYKLYENETLEKIQENPYRLAREVRGIGFKTADTMAQKLGFPKEASQRIDAGIEYVLHELSEEGHTCYPLVEFVEKAKLALETAVDERIEALLNENRLVKEEGTIWLKPLWLCEEGIAREITRLRTGISHLRPIDCEKAITWVEEKLKIQLAEKQKEAVKLSIRQKIHIITGGPGTGKSTITKAILTIVRQLTNRIILAAPTGRAAKRLSEITRRQAVTIHSLLQYDFTTHSFKRNRENPLPCDLLIVDEASMIDTHLMYHLLKALPDESLLLIIGDRHQLPSVGPGNILKDLIASNVVPVTELTEIFRQAAGSKIITNAHLINQGEFPDLAIDKGSDFFFLKAEEPEEAVEKIIHLVTERLPKSYHLDPIEDIQVLAPMRRGKIGIDNLNHVLQQTLNPQSDHIMQRGVRFGIHDKVMQIRNDYTKEVFNGDIGRVSFIDKEEEELVVSFDGKEVRYPFNDLDELVLAYATSIHKSQGNEYPCVIIPFHTSHYIMLYRNLLYTALTRGKRLVVIVGMGKAIGIAVSRDDASKRHSGLLQKLIRN